jgi:hypothetical protein
MAASSSGPYLKYAPFCRDTEEGPDQDLILKGVLDLVEFPAPAENPAVHQPVLAEVDVHLAFCIAPAPPQAPTTCW